MDLSQKIKLLSDTYFEKVISIRKHLHQHPELSFEEIKTSQYIVEVLKELNIPYTILSGTGIVAIIEGKNKEGKVIGLRAELDALPIQEQNTVSYKSIHDGKMHACGHDVHMSCLLGAAMVLNELKNEFNGIIKLIFQPGEEKLPGGASLMINDGVLENPKVDFMLAQHVAPDLKAGTIGFKSGLYMASSDEIYITVKGKGGHGALPHKTIDPIVISAQIILALQQISSRKADALIPTVLSFGKIEALGATNVIPSEVNMEGTFRTFDEVWRKEAHTEIKTIAEGIAKSFGAEADVKIIHGYPSLTNNVHLTETCKEKASTFLGAEQVISLPLRMTSEDFAYFSQKIPVCFYRLGTQSKNAPVTPVHTSTFNVDEKSVQTGMALMAWLAIQSLQD